MATPSEDLLKELNSFISSGRVTIVPREAQPPRPPIPLRTLPYLVGREPGTLRTLPSLPGRESVWYEAGGPVAPNSVSTRDRRNLLASGEPPTPPLVQNMPYFPGVSDQGLSVINGPYVPGAPSNMPLQIPMGAPLAPGVPLPPNQQLVIGPDGAVTYPQGTPFPPTDPNSQRILSIPNTIEGGVSAEAPDLPPATGFDPGYDPLGLFGEPSPPANPQPDLNNDYLAYRRAIEGMAPPAPVPPPVTSNDQFTPAAPPRVTEAPSPAGAVTVDPMNLMGRLAANDEAANLPNQFTGLARPESRVGRDLLTTPAPAATGGGASPQPTPAAPSTIEGTAVGPPAASSQAPAAPTGLSPQDAASFSFFLGQDTAAQLPAAGAPTPSPAPSREAPKGNKFTNAPRTPVPAGQQLTIDAQGNVTYPTQQGAPTPSNVPTPAAAPAPVTPMPGVLQRPTNAYTVGAPGMDDMTDRFGRFTPGAQSFAKTAFAAADNARKLLEDYKKANPNDKAGIAAREAASNQAAARASQANAWMAMPTSTRQRILTEGQVDADRASAIERGRQRINEMRQDPDLMRVLNDYNQTGVLRGGAGPGTATIPSSGAVISAPDAKGTRTLTSPYGTGSSTMLTPTQFANRPEAKIDGMPASQFFEQASARQGRDINVGGVLYSGGTTQLAPGNTSPTTYAQKQVEGRRAFWEEEAKKAREKGTAPIR